MTQIYAVSCGFPVTYSTIHPNEDCYLWRLDLPNDAWSSCQCNLQQWVQISSIKPEIWTAVITQGRPNCDQWTRQYKVSYTMNGQDWMYVDGGKVFVANYDRHTKVRNDFNAAVTARAIRIHPIKWLNWITMRFQAIFIQT